MENYGDATAPAFLCLGVDSSVDHDSICEEGSPISMMDCAIIEEGMTVELWNFIEKVLHNIYI